MKNGNLLSLLIILAVVPAANAQVQAQTQGQAQAAPVSSSPQAAVPAVSLDLGWSEVSRAFNFSLNNSGSSPLTVLGVQSTANLFMSRHSRQASQRMGRQSFLCCFWRPRIQRGQVNSFMCSPIKGTGHSALITIEQRLSKSLQQRFSGQ